MESQFKNQISLKYNLHPLILQLNSQLINEHPYNSLKFIKNWANKKIKQEESNQSQNEEIDNIIISKKKKIQFSQIKRRQAIFSQELQTIQYENKLPKNQVAKSIIMISLKNNIFLKHLSWQNINQLIENSQLLEFSIDTEIQKENQLMKSFFIIIQGEVTQNENKNSIRKVLYQGDSFGHQSFINQPKSKFSYFCQTKCLICVLSGKQIAIIQKGRAKQKMNFYQKCLMGINQFTYLDNQQLYKLTTMFKETNQMSAGQIVVNKGQKNIKSLYIVVQGEYSKCKKNISGQLIAFKTMRKGDIFGLQWLLNQFESQFSVMCMQQNSILAYVEKQAIEKTIQSYQKILKRNSQNNQNNKI